VPERVAAIEEIISAELKRSVHPPMLL